MRDLASVRSAAAVTAISTASVRRNPFIEAAETGGIGVYAADPQLLATLGGRVLQGRFLNRANERYPLVVLGTRRRPASRRQLADGARTARAGLSRGTRGSRSQG